jgi:uncharacterized protein DUF4258
MAPVTLVFRAHALERMFERGFTEDDVRQVVEGGKIIESYTDDAPYPSRLILGWRGLRPVHVVAADDTAGGTVIILTVYEPDLERWQSGFEKRRAS